MKTRYVAALLVPALLCGCAAGVNVDPMLQDFDAYEEDLQALEADGAPLETLEAGRVKRDEAGTLVESGKAKEALPLAERALADARLALEMEKMNGADRRAENCRLEVEQARTKWREAVFVLEQTEEFVGAKAVTPTHIPEPEEPEGEPLPVTTLEPDSFPPATMNAVAQQWNEWMAAAREREVATADLENAYREALAMPEAKTTDAAVEAHHRYLAARAAQSLECRVRTAVNERVCVEATRLMADFGDARADALRATLDLERGLQDDLRYELTALREEAKTRQEELYDALSQMQGKFASIRRDARGTIVSLADILFDFDKATLRREVEFNLVKIATILNQFGEMSILIEGHTDSIGSEEYNLGLSKRRAKSVYDFLVSQGVAESRLSWEGYGESRPVADNDTEEGRQRNRRVDLVIQDAPHDTGQ